MLSKTATNVRLHVNTFILLFLFTIINVPAAIAQYCPSGVPIACFQQDPNITYSDYQTFMARCTSAGSFWDDMTCTCDNQCALSPIIIDIRGDGFKLTNAAEGVAFDMNGDGTPEQISWTAAVADDAFLVLDRNSNGTIDTGQELFGNFTPQTPSLNRNGFAALRQLERFENGGNEDGVLDNKDRVFTSLRLWVDKNHNGVSEAGELFPLTVLGVHSISLEYREARRTDEYGNVFWYRAKVNSQMQSSAGRWAYDVLFRSE